MKADGDYKARAQRLLSALLDNGSNTFQFDEILKGHSEYQENMQSWQQAMERLAAVDGAGEILKVLKESSDMIRSHQKEAAYMQGVKDGLSLLWFSVGAEPLTLFSTENYHFKGMEGRGLHVKTDSSTGNAL